MVKKRLLMTLPIVLIFSFFISKTIFGQEARINTDDLNVRTGPGINYEKITKVHQDESYPIIQKTDKWVEIELSNGTGWVTTDYITIINHDEENNAEEVSSTNHNSENLGEIIITNDNTHIRSEPSVKGEIIRYVDQGTSLTVVSEEEKWYEVQYENQRGFIFKSLIDNKLSFSNNIRNKTIVIDAGHGGWDTGASGVQGFYEKDFTYMTTTKLQKALTTLGADVLLTRKNDEFIRLGSRPVLANMHDTNAFISIHYNSFPEMPSVTGIGTYYYDDYNQSLARSIQNKLVQSTNAKDRGIVHDNLLVLRQSYKPSVLLELGFISNKEKEQLLLTDHYQNQLVHGIVTGLSDYFMIK